MFQDFVESLFTVVTAVLQEKLYNQSKVMCSLELLKDISTFGSVSVFL